MLGKHLLGHGQNASGITLAKPDIGFDLLDIGVLPRRTSKL